MEKPANNKSVSEKLDSANARMRRRKSGEHIRRSLEAQLEAKARRAWIREQPASAGYKRNS